MPPAATAAPVNKPAEAFLPHHGRTTSFIATLCVYRVDDRHLVFSLRVGCVGPLKAYLLRSKKSRQPAVFVAERAGQFVWRSAEMTKQNGLCFPVCSLFPFLTCGLGQKVVDAGAGSKYCSIPATMFRQKKAWRKSALGKNVIFRTELLAVREGETGMVRAR